MSIKAMEMALEALEVRCGTNADERKPGGVIEVLRTAIQQAESEPVGAREALERIASWSDHPAMLGVDYGSNGVRDYYRKIARDALTRPAPGVPDGWRIEEKGGELIIKKNGFGGYSARKNTESIAEAVLHELALDLLAASPAQKW